MRKKMSFTTQSIRELLPFIRVLLKSSAWAEDHQLRARPLEIFTPEILKLHPMRRREAVGMRSQNPHLHALKLGDKSLCIQFVYPRFGQSSCNLKVVSSPNMTHIGEH